MLDLVLVGGGLANGLIAWRLLMTRPGVSFALVEAGATLGSDRTWCFRGTDVAKEQLEWLWVLCSRSWPAHDVVFEGAPRRLGGGFHAITSHDFHWKLMERLKDRVRLRAKVRSLTGTEVTLSSGEVLEARAVIDGRGLLSPPAWPCGFRKVLRTHVELTGPHGLEVPLVDGRVEQHGACRFVGLLPWDERSLLVEDTSYADDAQLELPVLRARVAVYLSQRRLSVARVLAEAVAVQPIPLEGALPAATLPTVGVAAGLFHATTGSTLPIAVALADELVGATELSAASLATALAAKARAHWDHQAFFRRFNRMLFRARPEQRARLFRSIYRHSEGLLERFHADQLSMLDKLRVLARA